MLTDAQFETIVAQARLAPSIHNAQPARWRRASQTIEIAADRSVTLPQADSSGAHIGLSCGAAVEATVLALSALGFACDVNDLWPNEDLYSWSGHRMAARLTLRHGSKTHPLQALLDARFTWRGPFSNESLQLFGWSRSDTFFILDASTRSWIAGLNDMASLGIMRSKPFRRELLSWMRLHPSHPRYKVDGLSRDALQIDERLARKVTTGFGAMWPLLDLLGKTAAMTAEADVTMTASLIACFHRPADESPVQSGRAYLRLCLEAAQLGLAGWPMAALTDDVAARAQVTAQLAIGPDRKLVQVLRFGVPTGPQSSRARHDVRSLIVA